MLAASYQSIAMDESKIENNLARKVVENPNNLSGARPASTENPVANTNSNTAVNANTVINGNTNANVKTNANAANANVR